MHRLKIVLRLVQQIEPHRVLQKEFLLKLLNLHRQVLIETQFSREILLKRDIYLGIQLQKQQRNLVTIALQIKDQ